MLAALCAREAALTPLLQADPCLLPCGHSFDRYCIARSLAVKQECPTCRAPQESKNPPEVRRPPVRSPRARAHRVRSSRLKVAVLLRDALALLFPEEIAKRGKQLEEERAAERERRAAEAAARAEEARRRAAQPRPAMHDGATMFALFQVPLAGPVRFRPSRASLARALAGLENVARVVA